MVGFWSLKAIRNGKNQAEKITAASVGIRRTRDEKGEKGPKTRISFYIRNMK